MIVVDDIEKILTKQYEAHSHELAQVKMKISVKLSRELMRNLLDQVSLYAFSKIYEQYLLTRLAKKKSEEHELKSCQKIFVTTMGLPCAHMIVAALEIEEKKLLLEDVHFHWRFKKPDSYLLTFIKDFVSDSSSNSSSVSSETDLFFFFFADDSDLFSDVNDLIRDRIELSLVFEMKKNSNLKDLRNIVESSVAKAKGRLSGSPNKKRLMTRAEKKAVKSTKRDLSGFEHMERNLAARAKCTKKIIDQAENDREGGRRGRGEASKARSGASTSRARGGATTRARGGATTSTVSQPTISMITRSGANVSMPMELFSNTEFSDAEVSDEGDGFNNLPESSSDEDFHASKQGDEDANDEWIH